MNAIKMAAVAMLLAVMPAYAGGWPVNSMFNIVEAQIVQDTGTTLWEDIVDLFSETPYVKAPYGPMKVVISDEWPNLKQHRRSYERDIRDGGWDNWLGGDNAMLETATEKNPPLRAWPVDRRVNNARNQGEELIEPDGDGLSD